MVIKPPQAKSSFLSVEKDMNIIVDRIIENKRLQKLLYYTVPEALEQKDLTQEQLVSLFQTNIRTVPKLSIDPKLRNYILIRFDDFVPNNSNPQFRNNLLQFFIICHFEQWPIKDFQLRPYKIAAELDSMFSQARFSGIGRLEFAGMNQVTLNADFAGFALSYYAIHGEEDKAPMLNPLDQAQFEEDFKEMMESMSD